MGSYRFQSPSSIFRILLAGAALLFVFPLLDNSFLIPDLLAVWATFTGLVLNGTTYSTWTWTAVASHSACNTLVTLRDRWKNFFEIGI